MSEPVGNSPRGNIPGNSHKERATVEETAEPREKVEKIIEGKVVTRKPPIWKRWTRGLIAEDAHTIKAFLITDIVQPTIRNAIFDIITQGTGRAVYGAGGSRRMGGGPAFGLRGDVGGIRTKYDQMAGEPRRMMSRESQARHDFDEVVLDSRAEAVAVVQDLIARVDRYGAASVSDLYDLVGVTGSFADQRWGWTDLRNADVQQTRGGFLLDLPRPEPLR